MTKKKMIEALEGWDTNLEVFVQVGDEEVVREIKDVSIEHLGDDQGIVFTT